MVLLTMFCAVFFAWAQPLCPTSVYCSTSATFDNSKCGNYCNNVGTWRTLTKPCYCTSPGNCIEVAYLCECNGIATPTSCTIPSWNVCMNYATTDPQCNTQCPLSIYSYKFNNGIVTCECADCEQMSTDSSFARYTPTPQPTPPTPGSPLSPTPKPTTTQPSPDPTMASPTFAPPTFTQANSACKLSLTLGFIFWICFAFLR
jgi:hypothetical protein